jgi:hypothetical protein
MSAEEEAGEDGGKGSGKAGQESYENAVATVG